METFQGFFSYAHHDAATDPALVEAFTVELERRVSARLTNAQFHIWRDVDNLRAGYRWDDRIAAAVRASHIMIVLLTPKWVERNYCRKEYKIFEEVENQMEVGEYVAPLLMRDIEKQIKYFDADQKTIYESISRRQYKKVLAADFLNLTSEQRSGQVEKIADDIAGIIERLRSLPPQTPVRSWPSQSRRVKKTYEFDTQAHNLRDVDFVSSAEIVIESRDDKERRAVFADLEFVERLYIQTDKGERIEFGVRRAYLSLQDGGAGVLERNDDWVTSPPEGVQYVKYLPAGDATTICVTASKGRSLADRPLPPAPNENYLSKVATLTPDTAATELKATLAVSLCPEGLSIAGENARPSGRTAKKIEAIMNILAQKKASVSGGKFQREVPVRERRR